MELIDKAKAKTQSITKSKFWFYRISVAVIILIFIFFFTSNMWLKVATSVIETPLGTSIDLGSDTTVTLKSWKYNKDSKYMVVDIGTDCRYVDTDYSFQVAVIDNLGRAVSTDVVYSNLEFMVLALSDIPNCSSLDIVITLVIKGSALDISSVSEESKGKSVSATFTSLIDDIEIDNNISTDLSEDEFIIQDWNYDIDVLNIQIKDVQDSIQANETVITNAEEKMTELEESKAYKTTDEIEVINSQIEKLNGVIETAKTDILESESDIAKLHEKITIVEQKINNFISGETADITVSEHNE